MTQNIIDVSWDLPKFDAQTQAVLENMSKVYELANLSKSNGIKPGSDGGYTELIKNNAAFNKVQESTLRLTKLQEQAEQARLRTQKLTQDAILAEAKARKANADAAIKEAAAKQKAANTVIDGGSRDVSETYNNNGGVAFSQERKAAQDAEVNSILAANTAQEEYSATVQQSTAAIVDRGTVSNKADYDALKLAEMKRLAEMKAKQELKNSAREQMSAKGSLEQRRAALIRLNAAYDNLNASERNSPYGVRMKNTIAGVTAQVKELETTTGRAQRNVGNYPDAFSKAWARATNVSAIAARSVQLLSRQIIQLGTGMLTFVIGAKALEAIGAYISKMYDQWAFSAGSAERKQLELQNRIDELNKTVEDSAKAFEDATSNLAKLTIDVDLAKQGFLDKDKVLKEYNDTMGKTTGQLKSFDDMEAKLIADGPDYIKLLFLKAEATASFAQAAIAAMKAITAQADAEKDFGNIDVIATNKMSILKQALGIGSLGENLADVGINSAKQVKKNAAFLKQQAEDSFNSLTKQGQDFEQQAAALAKFRGFNFFDEDKTKKKSSRVTMDSTKEALDLEFELYKIAQQRKIKLLDEGQNDTKKDFQERLIMAGEYTKAVIELSDRTYQHEIANDNAKLEVLRKNYAKSKGTEKNNIAVEIENTTKMILIAQSKQNSARLSMEDDFQKEQLSIRKDEADKELKAFEAAEKAANNVRTENQGAIDAQRAMEKAAHDELLHDKIITQKQYDKAEKKSINDSLLLSLNADLKKEESLRALAILQHQNTVDIDNQINETKAKIASAKNGLDDIKKVPPVGDSLKSIADSGKDLATGLVDIKYQKELTAIQKIIDLNNYRKDQEIANINASTLSNQEKAAQMIILDNTVAANNKKLEREKVALQIKQAKFDRDSAILSIIENATIAEFKLPAQGGFAGIAAGIAIGVAAAASIAMLLAKPLPSMPAYAEGTDNHPGGPAIVGEGKFKELVSSPDGKSFIASRPMLLNNLPKGSKVTPLTTEMIMAGMEQSANMSMAERIVFSNKIQAEGNRVELSAIKEAVYETGRMTAQALRKQKGANVNVYVDSSWNAYISKVVKE